MRSVPSKNRLLAIVALPVALAGCTRVVIVHDTPPAPTTSASPIQTTDARQACIDAVYAKVDQEVTFARSEYDSANAGAHRAYDRLIAQGGAVGADAQNALNAALSKNYVTLEHALEGALQERDSAPITCK
jgi:hypothetical protein